jgi:hypothetical protein
MFASNDDDVRRLSPPLNKNKHAVNVSLTVFDSVPVSFPVPVTGAVVLFVLVVMGWLDGSFGLATFVTTTAMMAAVATKTDPSITALNLRDILDQTMTSGAGIGIAS